MRGRGADGDPEIWAFALKVNVVTDSLQERERGAQSLAGFGLFVRDDSAAFRPGDVVTAFVAISTTLRSWRIGIEQGFITLPADAGFIAESSFDKLCYMRI